MTPFDVLLKTLKIEIRTEGNEKILEIAAVIGGEGYGVAHTLDKVNTPHNVEQFLNELVRPALLSLEKKCVQRGVEKLYYEKAVS